MRDVTILPVGNETVIVASDNSGAIGLKEMDVVKVPYEVVGYYTFRVAAMECYCAGAEPQSVIIQNFCGDEAWDGLLNGVTKGLTELGVTSVTISGSTESNFSLIQSAVGLTILGKRTRETAMNSIIFQEDINIAVIGIPLVGNEVMEQEGQIAPLVLVKELSLIEDTVLLPVGSKGILYELNQLFSNRTFKKGELPSTIDVEKTSGPSTCLLIAFPAEKERRVKKLAGHYYHELRGGQHD